MPDKKNKDFEITKATRISEILETYGDIAEVMEVFGIKRVARYSLRALAAKALTVEWAARIHGVPLDKFLDILNQATHPNAAQSE
jgi:hypothetical protein